MNKYLKYFKAIILTFIIILLLNIILSLLNYYSSINIDILKYIRIIIFPIAIFFGGFYLGTKINKKGYIEGLKLGLLFFIIFFIINILLKNITIKNIIYYFSIIISSICGSMIGINKRKN